MKKLISIILLSAMIFALAACRTPVDPATEPTAGPAIATPDCAEPTAEPTVGPTAEPAEAAEPVDLDFRACGEQIARIPMGSGELEAHIQYDGGVWAPEHYCVADGKLYVCNGYTETGSDIEVLIFDLESGSVRNRLIDSGSPILSEFAVKDGRLLITPDFMIDLESGEAAGLQRLIPEGGGDERQRVIAMRAANGKCFAYVGDSMDPFLSRTIDEYELDEANRMWKLMRRVTEPAGDNGFKAEAAEFSIGEVRYFSNPTNQDDVLISGRYIGANPAGEHFVNYRYHDEELGREFDVVERFSPDGAPVSRVKIDSTALYTQDNCRLFNMDGDGNVYFMAEDDEYLTVYRVSTEVRAYELAFEDCAELAFRLPWGNGETEVFIERPTEGYDDEDWVIPQHFNVIGGKVYVFDRYNNYGSGVLECDPVTGGVTRLSPDIGEYSFITGEFAVLNGKIVFGACMYDLETGERTELQRISNSDFMGAGILFMSVRDGKCFAYRAVDKMDDFGHVFFFVPETDAYDEYELDMENRMWVLVRRIEMPKNVPHASPDLSDDSEFYASDRYMGMDDAGNHYVDSYESIVCVDEEGVIRTTVWNRIVKLSPDGRPTAYVDVYFPDNYIHMWIDANYLIYKVDGDGTVWYMCETEDELLVYRIVL